MNGEDRRMLEQALRAHYRAERPRVDADARHGVAASVRAETACTEAACGAPAATDPPGFAAFVASQVRFVHPWVWVAQVALVATMAALCWAGGFTTQGIAVTASLLGAMTVLVGLPDLFASKTQGVAELECACLFDCRAVMVARLIILGCSDAVVVTCIALASPLAFGSDVLCAFLHVCVPYFLACAGSLLVARRCAGSSVLPLSCAWTLLVMAVAYAVSLLVPDAYASASVGVWALVCTVSVVWAGREVRAWLAGLVAGSSCLAAEFSPGR